MGINIDYKNGLTRRKDLLRLLEYEKVGSSLTYHGTHGFTWLSLSFVKMNKTKLYGYSHTRYSWGTPETNHNLMIVTKDHVEFLKGHTGYERVAPMPGEHSNVFRAFITLGFIDNIQVRTLRHCEMLKCNGEELATHYPMKLSWNGDRLSKISKEVRQRTKNTFAVDKNTSNAHARSNYQNTRVLRLLNEAQKTNDWSKLKTSDVFKLRNVAKRTALIEHFGMETILKDQDHEVIDKDQIDGREYELLRIQLPNMNQTINLESNAKDKNAKRPATYLRMINPSTGETCVEGVPNNRSNIWSKAITMDTVKDALAWRDGDVGTYKVPVALT